MIHLIKNKAHGLVKLFPRKNGSIRTIIKLMDDKGKRTESLALDVVGVGIFGEELTLKILNGKTDFKTIPFKNIFDIDVQYHFLTLNNNSAMDN
ncbi:MAG: hypothetical protein ABIJ81_04530 [Patescibacteria group bacterium]